ncbi:MAG: LCP family protein, partial [Pseudonocardia sp.]|nr:LCP family protein [Pseudonocardia sp.]
MQRIDESLTRLTAAHAGLTLGTARDKPAEDAEPGPRKRPNKLRLAALAVTTVVVVTAGVGWGAQRWLTAAVPSAAALDPGSGAIVDAPAQAGDENVLLVATDRTATSDGGARSDTVVVAHLPKGNGPMTVLAIPPDLEISRPPCERYDASAAAYTPDSVPAQARTQLTSALDLGGPRCATRAVQQLTGLAITRYVGVDLAELGDAVNALSGVRFCTPRAVVDAALGPVVPTPGTITLDAEQVTAFVRAASV